MTVARRGRRQRRRPGVDPRRRWSPRCGQWQRRRGVTGKACSTTAAVSAKTLTSPATATVTGTVSLATPGTHVQLLSTSGGWRTLASATVSAGRHYRFTFHETKAGTYLLRVVMPASSTDPAGISPTIRLTADRRCLHRAAGPAPPVAGTDHQRAERACTDAARAGDHDPAADHHPAARPGDPAEALGNTGTSYTYAFMAAQPHPAGQSPTLENNAVVVNGLVYSFGGYQGYL